MRDVALQFHMIKKKKGYLGWRWELGALKYGVSDSEKRGRDEGNKEEEECVEKRTNTTYL